MLTHRRKAFRGAYDADAATYFAAIVTAGSSITTANKNAVNAFVVGCKADGIWTAIKASCLLAGPDDLTGALVPLVGTAPTNVSFVSGDYSRTTGLLGDGSTKYLNSNRNNNVDPQDSRHVYARITVAQLDTSVNRRIFGTSAVSGATWWGINLTPQYFSRCSSAATSAVGSVSLSTGGVGVSRSASASYNRMNYGSVASVTNTSVAPADQNVGIFAAAAGFEPTNARLAFYSIGESLDLALLDARLATYVAALT